MWWYDFSVDCSPARPTSFKAPPKSYLPWGVFLNHPRLSSMHSPLNLCNTRNILWETSSTQACLCFIYWLCLFSPTRLSEPCKQTCGSYSRAASGTVGIHNRYSVCVLANLIYPSSGSQPSGGLAVCSKESVGGAPAWCWLFGLHEQIRVLCQGPPLGTTSTQRKCLCLGTCQLLKSFLLWNTDS